ncbi:MAG: ATP-binding protein [Acetobacteraceae bacterium]|nr:ATP-binding protein [Acetobacteraceae bacterium]
MPDSPDGGILRLSLPLSAESVGVLLDRLEAWAETHEIPMTVASRMNLVAEEIAANVVMHAAGATFFAVTAARAGDEIWLAVEDDGPAYDPLSRAEPDTDAALEDRDPGGLGVMLVRRLCATARYERTAEGRNRLECTLAAGA